MPRVDLRFPYKRILLVVEEEQAALFKDTDICASPESAFAKKKNRLGFEGLSDTFEGDQTYQSTLRQRTDREA